MQRIWILVSVLFTALLGMLYPVLLPWVAISALMIALFLAWREQKRGFSPKGEHYKTLEKIEKKRAKVDKNKHLHIHDQIAYIEQSWGYTKEQSTVIERFIEQRAYSDSYNRLTASLLPQLIALIDHCNDREKKGCKREVGRRLRELIDLMKIELKKQKSRKHESFEVALEVYDRLIGEVK